MVEEFTSTGYSIPSVSWVTGTSEAPRSVSTVSISVTIVKVNSTLIYICIEDVK